MNERRSLAAEGARVRREAAEPRARRPGARPLEPVGADLPSGSVLWRRWLELHREGDSAAETQLLPRPRPTAAPTPASVATSRSRAASAASRAADADRKLFGIYEGAFNPVIGVRREAPPRASNPGSASARRRPAPSPQLESRLTGLPRAVRRLLARGNLWSRLGTKGVRPRAGKSLMARRVALSCLTALCVGAVVSWRLSSSASAALATEPSASPLPPPDSSSAGHRVESRPLESRGPVNPAIDRRPSTWQTAAGAPPPVEVQTAAGNPKSAGSRAAPPPGGTALRTALEASDSALLAKLAVDALAAGDRTTAATHYRELARRAPENPSFVDAARILSRPTRGSR
jgi:hypothetical protein